jgi:hypothetical protein
MGNGSVQVRARKKLHDIPALQAALKGLKHGNSQPRQFNYSQGCKQVLSASALCCCLLPACVVKMSHVSLGCLRDNLGKVSHRRAHKNIVLSFCPTTQSATPALLYHHHTTHKRYEFSICPFSLPLTTTSANSPPRRLNCADINSTPTHPAQQTRDHGSSSCASRSHIQARPRRRWWHRKGMSVDFWGSPAMGIEVAGCQA